MRTVLTEEEQSWLVNNYESMLQPDIARCLGVSTETVRKYVQKLGVRKARKKKAKPVVEVNPIPALLEGYCIDCAYYMVGGICRNTGRSTGALNKKHCFKNNRS